MGIARLLRPSVLLRRNALYRGLLGGSRGWLAIGALLWGKGLLKKLLGKDEQVLAVEKLKAGQGIRIDAIRPDTRRQRRAVRRASSAPDASSSRRDG
jgi:hypothetical protein